MRNIVLVVAVATRSAVAEPIEAPRDPAIATSISLGTTGLSLVLIYEGWQRYNGLMTIVGVGGLMAGPSLGYIYGTGGEATAQHRGLTIRAAGAGMMLAGLVVDVKDLLEHGPCDLSCPTITTGEYLMAAGLAVAVAGAALDISEVGAATLRANARRSAPVHLAPITMRTPGQSTVLGFGLQGRL
jgi:F0F1-type ATP synthase membrane subunit c/vacuolar-type H+-ATPase subunit K